MVFLANMKSPSSFLEPGLRHHFCVCILGSSPKELLMYELAVVPIPPKAGIPLPLYPPLHFMLKIPPEAGERG